MEINIWPNSNKKFSSRLISNVSHHDVENKLSSMFEHAYPVVCSSARSCISLIIEDLKLSRGNFVKVPAYASHCVLESTSRFATPITYNADVSCDASIIYHQWGITQENTNKSPGVIIEDACDSIYSEKHIRMPLGGDYEIWSLPKILGCSSGGVIWCRNKADAKNLSLLRNKRKHSGIFHWYLRVLGRKHPVAMSYWNGVESLSGQLPSLALNEILFTLDSYDAIVEQRKDRLDLARSCLDPVYKNKEDGRLPCCLPLSVSNNEIKELANIGIDIGIKHFEKINSSGKSELTKVYPLPVHQDIPMDMLESSLKILKK